MNIPILEVRDLVKEYTSPLGFLNPRSTPVKALQGISFQLNQGETLGLIGESGCGKSTLGRCILRMIEPTNGNIFFKGEDISKHKPQQMKPLRRKMQIIFQDPYSSLNPRMKISQMLEEPLLIHDLYPHRAQRTKRIKELLDIVGLPADCGHKYAHEFSGGQRQRIGIARALAVEPELIVCDEPVSALDVSIQAQIINLLMDLQKQLRLSYLFIAHDLRVVEHISHRVAVMYLGKIVELASSDNIFTHPQHPYTQALLSATPNTDPNKKKNRIVLEGDVPSVTERCKTNSPLLTHTRPDHQSACWLRI